MTTLRSFRPGLWLTDVALDEFDVRGAVIVGATGALVWDTLSHPRDMAPVRDLLADRPFFIAYSHADWDHVWGTDGLPAPQAIVAHAACAARFTTDVPEKLAAQRAAQPGQWDAVVLLPPSITFTAQLTLDLGGVTVELHHLPGHSADCLVAFIPEWGVLLAGDTVETPFPLVYAGGRSLAGWIQQLVRWAQDVRVATVIPCHGEIGGRAVIQRNIAYLTALQTGDRLPGDGEMSAFYDASHVANVENVQASAYTVRRAVTADLPAVEAFVVAHWGSARQVINKALVAPAAFSCFVAQRAEELIGLASFRVEGATCQLLLLNSLEPGLGMGRRLVDAVADAARGAGCRRMTVVTTNDNLPALRFYQRYGFVIHAVRPNALAAARRLKPEIPAVGVDDLPLRDEIELELKLA